MRNDVAPSDPWKIALCTHDLLMLSKELVIGGRYIYPRTLYLDEQGRGG